jgi:D-glycero-D-manno-heptose 1,7-bisphosphate phosphatase
MMNKAVFIDKDGTLIPDIPYNVNPALITLSDGAGEVLQELKRDGYLLVVISNQAGVAKGLFPESAIPPIRQKLDELLGEFGLSLDGFYYCPHLPTGEIIEYALECECRKPKAGMLLRAAQDLNINLQQSWMIGDITADSEAGKRAGCRTILIEKTYDPILHLNDQNRPDFIVAHWQDVRPIILAQREGV